MFEVSTKQYVESGTEPEEDFLAAGNVNHSVKKNMNYLSRVYKEKKMEYKTEEVLPS